MTRVLFSAVPAHGHVLPMVPLMEAALCDGHDVALTTSDEMAAIVRSELPPGVEHLPAGPMPLTFSVEGARRTGHDLRSPMDADTVGEIFGGARLDATADAALTAAGRWRPDAVVVDVLDTVGPMIAAALGTGWHTLGITPGIDSTWLSAIDRVATSRYTARGLAPTAPASYIDTWPPLLRDPDDDLSRGAPRHALRTRPHRGTAPARLPAFSDPSKPTVLVTLGTVFSSTDTLAEVVDAVARPEINVLATLGLSLDSGSVVGAAVLHQSSGVRRKCRAWITQAGQTRDAENVRPRDLKATLPSRREEAPWRREFSDMAGRA